MRHVFFALLGLMVFTGLAQQVEPLGIVPQPMPLLLTVATSKHEYVVGEALTLTVFLNRPAYVYILEKDPLGRLRLIFPNYLEPWPYIPAGTNVLPRNALYVLEPPAGRYEIYAVAYESLPPFHPSLPLNTRFPWVPWVFSGGTLASTTYTLVYAPPSPSAPSSSSPSLYRWTALDIAILVVAGVIVVAVTALAWERIRGKQKATPPKGQANP
ncbi:MAG: DUF4384 domain-containing protein [Thermofilaceae archaeon]